MCEGPVKPDRVVKQVKSVKMVKAVKTGKTKLSILDSQLQLLRSW
jgi:hypothetical protein